MLEKQIFLSENMEKIEGDEKSRTVPKNPKGCHT